MANVYINKRTIFLSDGMNEETIGIICNSILTLIEEDNEKDDKEKNFKREIIKLYINTDGGNVYDTFALVDIILKSKTPIYTYCVGHAMSAGFALFVAGSKRYISKNSILMLHTLTAGNYSNLKKLTDSVSEYKRLNEQLEEYYLSRTEIVKERLDEIYREQIDWYITPDEAIKLKIADEIIEEI